MPINSSLVITANSNDNTATFRLLDGDGVQRAFRHTDFKTIPLARRRGLFDLRTYLKMYVEPKDQAVSVAEIGVCIAEEVLGADIFRALWNPMTHRVVTVQLPGAAEDHNPLAAALARVPWEIARPSVQAQTLAERNLLIRFVHGVTDPDARDRQSLGLDDDEPLRVLFVFAEARGSRPLAARMERRELLQLFEREIYPQRRVIADVLTHGVTRQRLKSQIQERSGYHIIHWSGHGHLNLLQLAKAGGGGDGISGDELLALCGGFIPRLVFLSACHSGEIMRVKNWQEFMAVAQGAQPDPGGKGATDEGADERADEASKELPLSAQPGYTGTAHALLQGGVPSVVAMRYEVGDEYARELAVEFYRALLAHSQPKKVAAALTLARQELRDPDRLNPGRFAHADHATPALYGEEDIGLTAYDGRSPALDRKSRRLQRIVELTTADHEDFVGRTWELAGLGADFIGSRGGTEVKPVAVISGLGGMGKTALTAEVLALWESRFEWVLLYQAKPHALSFEATLRDIHAQLSGELKRYHRHIQTSPADAIYRAATDEFTGAERLERLTSNFIRALRDEPILLVLDNFETNLAPAAAGEDGAATEQLLHCQDPTWDRCLARLADELVGSPSRVIITSRRPLAALAGRASYSVMLGPLPAGEAALYLREHGALSQMMFGGDTAERVLAQRLLKASRFHPLLMNRLARLAATPSLRPQLMHALETLEKSGNYTQLPGLFAADPGDAKELTYLNDALATSLDQLLRDVGADARRLLWMIALANEPVNERLVEGVWSGESYEVETLRRFKQMLVSPQGLSPKNQDLLNVLPPEVRARLDELAPASEEPLTQELIQRLLNVGLVTNQSGTRQDTDLTCHELVRERSIRWMQAHPAEQAGATAETVRLAYAERLEHQYLGLMKQEFMAALQAGSRAVAYYAQARAWDRLSGFTSSLVNATSEPYQIAALLPHLETAAESAPPGRSRWSCLGHLADALRNSGRADESLVFYQQAVDEARKGTTAAGQAGIVAWADLFWLTSNWALAEMSVGNLNAARRQNLESVEFGKKAGVAESSLMVRELEVLRLDIQLGKVEEALPHIQSRLALAESWWQQYRSGTLAKETRDADDLYRVVITAVDVANDAHRARGDWESALRTSDSNLEVKQAFERPAHDIAATRFNRATELSRLGRYDEARGELEVCLRIFEDTPANRAKVLDSLGVVFRYQGDFHEAANQTRRALAILAQVPEPVARAISHFNLGLYLTLGKDPQHAEEARRHRLAALIYRYVSGLGEALQRSFSGYSGDFRTAAASGGSLEIPQVRDLVMDPMFYPLAEWLQQRKVDLDALQTEIDEMLSAVRVATEAKLATESGGPS